MSTDMFSVIPTGESRGARRTRLAAQREALAQRESQEASDGLGEDFPLEGPSKWGPLTQMWGPPVPRLNFHQTTSLRFGVATPFLSESGIGHRGAVIGPDAQGGGVFAVDPWELYRQGLTTGTSMISIGMVGSGKSTTNKALACRLIALGRRVAVGSDPRAEWVPVAHQVGGTVIDINPGGATRINPLDPGVRPEGVDDDKWARMISARRSQLLLAVLSLLNHGREFNAYAQTALSEALKAVTTNPAITVPTIPHVMDALLNPSAYVRELTRDQGTELGLLLRTLVDGDLAGLFDAESTIDVDGLGRAPMIVFDTSALLGGAEIVLSIATACINAWLDSVIMARSNSFWLIVNEEGWSSMRDARNVELLDARQRMAGEWGIANMLIMHELKDLDMVGPEGSAQRNQALGLLSKAQVKIIHRQAIESADGLASILGLTSQERDLVVNLTQGEALWKVGKKSFHVKTQLTQGEFEVFNTDARRAG